ncbi:hypothetical protein ACFQT0_04550 [Hymenobacter humi]|uniref:DUF6311 domain-containing protein n=1 Tax=Hymenobacter humi TaxID=1411620 RepID=A0ABW2U1L6_9BACT
MKASGLQASSRAGLLAVLLAGAVLVGAFFWFVLLAPNDYYFGLGDGVQAYFTTSYYARYGAWAHFSGMNYPEGDHINYTNMQPLLAGTMRLLELIGLPVATYTVGITNLLALLGLALAPGPLYLLLRRSRLPAWYAGITALLIAFLSPQVLRFSAHLALSYVVFFPWLWYCIVRMQDEPRAARWYTIFAVSLTLMGFIVPYYVALGSLFLLGHVLLLVLWQRRLGPLAWRMAVAAIVPLLIMQGWLWLTDSVTDRPANPYGLLVYKATLTSVFLPVLAPLQPLWSRVVPLEMAEGEGWSYVGLATTITLVVSGLLALAALVVRRQRAAFVQCWAAVPVHLRTGLWAATLLLLFSFAIPFRWESFAWLTDHAGPIKQFRALGRFAWPFYYVGGCYAAYCLYTVWERQVRRGAPRWQLVWLPLVLLGWAGEAWINVDFRASMIRDLTGASSLLDKDASISQQLSWVNRRPQEFQAILSLPYFILGTDKLSLNGSEGSFYQSYNTAFVTGLPLLANHTTRASAGAALRHIQLLSSPLLPKELLAHLPSAKPFLVVVGNGPLSPAEQRITAMAKLLYAGAEGALYELPVAALVATTQAAERAQAAKLLPNLPVRSGGLRCTTPKGVLLRTFDDGANRSGHLAAGAFYEAAPKYSVLYDGPVPMPADTGNYEVSVWINGKTAYGLGSMLVRQYVGDQVVDQQGAGASGMTEVDGDWLRWRCPCGCAPGFRGWR